MIGDKIYDLAVKLYPINRSLTGNGVRETLEILKKVGIEDQGVPKKTYQVRSPLWVEQDGAMIMVLPEDNFRVSRNSR